MRILNFGSLNIDYVYRVDNFLKPGETKAALSRNVFAGGKGLNQSIALARENGVYVHQSPELVNLLMQIDLDSEIPPELYQAVAEILAWLYALDQKSMSSQE